MKKITISAVIILLSSFFCEAQLELDFETGRSFNTSNEIRFPNNAESTADFVNIPEEFGGDNVWFSRLRLSYTINDKHTISALYAPLTFENSGNFSEPVNFGDFTFSPSENTAVTYQFNSYRLTYRYLFVDREKFKFGAGITGKIRDARIAFSTENKDDETTDVGFVPLINFKLEYLPAEKWIICLQGDALIGTQGRAEDIFAGLKYKFTDFLSLKGGYRILEGGADVGQVYNFSLIQYASVGCLVEL